VCKGNAKFIVVTTKHGPTNGSAGSGGEFTIDGTTYPDGNCSYLLDPDPAPPSPPSFISDVRVCVFPMGSNPYPSTIAPALGTLPQDGAYEGTLYDAYTCLPSANPPSACIAPDFTVTPRRAKLTMTYTVGLSEANDCDDRLAVAGRQYPATNGKLFEGTTPSGLHSNDGGSAWITWDNECSGDEGGNDDDGDCTKVPHYRGLAAGVHNDGNSDGKGLIVCISAFTQAEVDWIQAQCSAL
jgi:hypothetical protein